MYAQGGTVEGKGQVIGKDGQVKAEFILKSDPLTKEQAEQLNKLEADNGNHAQHDH